MQIADAFAGKRICLVLACNREFYEKRRQENQATFDILKKTAFVIVYLYADNSISDIKFAQVSRDEYKMYIPAPEIYELLPYKVNVAYDFFSRQNIAGILKIDDNTVIGFPDIIEHDFIDLTTKYDYIGLEQVKISKDKTPYIRMVNRTKESLLENIYHKVDIDVTYFAGPFYYLSPRAVAQVAAVGLRFGYEDMAVGYAVAKDPKIKSYLWNFKNRGVSWDNKKELEPNY